MNIKSEQIKIYQNKLNLSGKRKYRKKLIRQIFRVVDEKFPNISNKFKQNQNQEPFSEKAYFKFIIDELSNPDFEYKTEITGDMCRCASGFNFKNYFLIGKSDSEIESTLQVYNFLCDTKNQDKEHPHVEFLSGPDVPTILEQSVLTPEEKKIKLVIIG
jgi:hypothetical protein